MQKPFSMSSFEGIGLAPRDLDIDLGVFFGTHKFLNSPFIGSATFEAKASYGDGVMYGWQNDFIHPSFEEEYAETFPSFGRIGSSGAFDG